MDLKTITYLTMQQYINILPIATPHMEEFILEAATKKRLFWV